MQKEIWKDIVGYEGLYQVSNLGNVKSIYKSGKEKILKAGKNKGGYLTVYPCKNGKQRRYLVHRLVAQAFLGDYSEELEVDHINTIRDDNRVENLRMCTRKENNNNELTKKHMSEALKGKHHSEETKKKMSKNHADFSRENNPNYGKHHLEETKRKISESHKKPIYCIELDKTWDCIKDCSEELGLYATSITQVCKGKLNQTKGYHFRYLEKMKD